MKRTLRQMGLGFAVLLFTSTASWAATGVNLQTFSPSTSNKFVFTEDAYMSEWPKPTKYYFGANYNYFNEPLVVLDSTQTIKQFNYIDSIQTFDFFVGMRVAPTVGLFAALPIHYVNYASVLNGAASVGGAGRTVMGDLKLLGKIRVTDDSPDFAVAILPEIRLPTGSNLDFVSDASAYLGLKLALERKFESFTFAANLGYAAAANSIYQDANFVSPIDYRKRLIVGLGGLVPFNQQWGLNVEYNNINSLPFDKNLNPNDFYGGLRYHSDAWAFTGGMSFGRIGGAQQNLRFLAGLRFNVFEEQKMAPKPINYPIKR